MNNLQKKINKEYFVENTNNCACITAWQFINLSHITYNDFKDMVYTMPASKYDKKILQFIEKTIIKYWDKNITDYPRATQSVQFCTDHGDIKWSDKGYITNVTNEYCYIDIFVHFLLRFATLIDIFSY